MLDPEDVSFRRGQEDGAREACHVQVVETGMVFRVLRLGDHRGDEPVADAVLDGFQVVFPDGDGGSEVGREVGAVSGNLSARQEGNLGEGGLPETHGPGFFRIEERTQRDGRAVRPRAGAGKKVIGGQVAVQRRLRGGDAAVPDGVRAAGVRPIRHLAARNGEQEEGQRKEGSFGRDHNQVFKGSTKPPSRSRKQR